MVVIVPITSSVKLGRNSSWVSPTPSSLIPAVLRPRSTNAFTKAIDGEPEHNQCIRLGLQDLFHIGREVRLLLRCAGAADDVAAGRLERLVEVDLGVDARGIVADDGVDLADAVVVRPFAERRHV